MPELWVYVRSAYGVPTRWTKIIPAPEPEDGEEHVPVTITTSHDNTTGSLGAGY